LGKQSLDKKSEQVLGLLFQNVKDSLDKDRCFEWNDSVDLFLRNCGIENTYDFIDDLVRMDALREPTLGFLQFPGHGVFYSVDPDVERNNLEEKNMEENERKDEESKKDSSEKDDAVQDNTASKQAVASESKQTTFTDAREVISSSGDFKLQKISEFLGYKTDEKGETLKDENGNPIPIDEKEAILHGARLIKGKFGMVAILDLEEMPYD